ERLLSFLGADISQAGNRICLNGPFKPTVAFSFTIPGDVSSAAFFAVAAATFPGSRIELKNILLNSGRTGFFNVLKRMGTGVSFNEQNDRQNEPVGTAVITGGTLHGVEIVAAEIPSLIDELPALAVAMAFANGPSQVTGASELRRKETDRISNLISQLQKAGVKCQELTDGFRIEGNSRLTEGIAMEPADDHRLAMAFAILARRSGKGLFIKNPDCVNISFPDFFKHLQSCIKG
ncbi:MAG TPA: 3-phosphoshikimate 1-carboxyvinyltransferase, partial [Candidatus Rifleibacterium sp.]|nr:3-phosphoshikimate 1-carboxyvinyltransferase [Candidatus Rifleibacterium sp.]